MSTAVSNSFEWSVLPPVPLFGVGTELVESAEHYASRLAWISGIDIDKLCALPEPFRSKGKGGVGGVAKFCGPGPVYRNRIENLEALTGISTIRCGSFLVLHDLLGASSMGRRDERDRWCPECFLKWDEDSSWEPLIWQSDLVTTCPVHGCDLINRCEKCHASRRLTSKYQQRRKCAKCGSGLAGRGRTTKRPGYYKWVQSQFCDLVRLCATSSQEMIAAKAYDTFLQGLISIRPRKSKCPWPVRNAIERACSTRRRSRASARTLINLCAIQGVSVVEMLLDPAAAASKPLLDIWGGYRCLDLDDRPYPTEMRVLDEILSEIARKCRATYLPTVQFMLSKLGIDVATARKFSRAYSSYQDAYKRQGRMPSSDQVFRMAFDAMQSGLDEKSCLHLIAVQASVGGKVSARRVLNIVRDAAHVMSEIDHAVAEMKSRSAA